MWLETMMALIGEQFDDADEICGVVASVRHVLRSVPVSSAASTTSRLMS